MNNKRLDYRRLVIDLDRIIAMYRGAVSASDIADSAVVKDIQEKYATLETEWDRDCTEWQDDLMTAWVMRITGHYDSMGSREIKRLHAQAKEMAQ